MIKTGLKSFVYSFSVSLFAIISVNRAFFYEKKQTPYDLDIQNKSIALYLTETKPSYVPVKKIALNSIPDVQKSQNLTPPLSDPEIIVASKLESLDIPLEFVDETITDTKTDVSSSQKKDIVLADVLYAPNKPLPMPEIKAEPVYQPEESIEIKIASAPVYNPEQKKEVSIKAPPLLKKQEQAPEAKEDNSLLIARNETVDNIPLIQTNNNNGVNKVQIGKPSDLQHIAFADNKVPVQSVTPSKPNEPEDKTDIKEWKNMSDSPWVIAKSTGSKNLLANKTDKEFAELVPLEKNKKGVILASETPKNLIIPIPEDILNQKDITPQLAYPVTSEDKKKEIDINAKIKEAEEKKKALEVEKNDKPVEVLTPIEEEIIVALDTPPPPPVETNTQDKSANDTQNDSIIKTISSLFNKSAKTVSKAADKVIEKAKKQKNRFERKKVKNTPVTIMPAEIRLAFQPNRAEISGQTLRWIQALQQKQLKHLA